MKVKAPNLYTQKITYEQPPAYKNSEFPGVLRQEDEDRILWDGTEKSGYTDYQYPASGLLLLPIRLPINEITFVRGFFNYEYGKKRLYSNPEKSGEVIQGVGRFPDETISFFGDPQSNVDGIDISFFKKGDIDKEFFLFFGSKHTEDNESGFFMQIYIDDERWLNLKHNLALKTFNKMTVSFRPKNIAGLYQYKAMGFGRWKILDKLDDIDNLSEIEDLPDYITSQEEIIPYHEKVDLTFFKDDEEVELLEQEVLQAKEIIFQQERKERKVKEKVEKIKHAKKHHKEQLVKHEKIRKLWENELKEKCEGFEAYINKKTIFEIGGFGSFLGPGHYPGTGLVTTRVSCEIYILKELSNGEFWDFPYYKLHVEISVSNLSEIVFRFYKEKLNGDIDYDNEEFFEDIDTLLIGAKNFVAEAEEEFKKQEGYIKK